MGIKESLAQKTTDRGRVPSEWIGLCCGYDTGIPHPNVAELLEPDELNVIGQRVVYEFDLDETSRQDWLEQSKRAIKLAQQVKEIKTDPFEGCANVKWPLMTVAALQFSARAYPEIVQENGIVKCEVIGEDPEGMKADRADRVSKHMTWQLTKEMVEWEEETDRLLVVLPIVGIVFRKTYFDPVEKRNISELVLPDDFVVHYKTKSLETVRRATHRWDVYNNTIFERVAAGIWLDADLPIVSVDPDRSGEEDVPHEFLEQHRYWDLDGDGYQEPYIVTVHRDTGKVVRIVANYEKDTVTFKENGDVVSIRPIQYFTKFGFFPNPDGSFYDLGFGQLLEPINESINGVLNQLLDAGADANRGGGFISSNIKIKGGVLEFKRGEWKQIQNTGAVLRDGIVPRPTAEPSMVLFQLLGLLVEAGNDIAQIKDILSGQTLPANTPATTTLSMVEQGLKVFGALYKRIYRSLTQEYRKLFRLNGIYMDPKVVFRVLDVPVQVFINDYQGNDCDVYPVSDPNIGSDVQRMLKSRALLELSGRAGLNEIEVTKRAVDSLRVPNPKSLVLTPEEMPPPAEDPNLLAVKGQLVYNAAILKIKEAELELATEEMLAKIEKMRAEAMLALAKAEAAEAGPQLDIYKQQMDMIGQEARHRVEIIKAVVQQMGATANGGGNPNQPDQGSVPQLEAPAGNQGVLPGA